jgi:tetratricopeptide (TPR) repeat protein
MQNNPDYQGAALSQQKQDLNQYMQFYGGDNGEDMNTCSDAVATWWCSRMRLICVLLCFRLLPANSQYTYDNLLHDEVTKMFLNALSIRPDDPDLHTVLGVLYHISSDFDKAIEAFKNAVKLKPDDAALWNKLGATQANSSRSGDAVHAYKR